MRKTKEAGKTEVYSPEEGLKGIYWALIKSIPAKIRVSSHKRGGDFSSFNLEIFRSEDVKHESARLVCEGIYFENNEGKPIIIAYGEIEDPFQLSEKGNTLLFVKPQIPFNEKVDGFIYYIHDHLLPVAYESEPQLIDHNRFERIRNSGLIISRGRYFKDELSSQGGYIAVDKVPENSQWPQIPKTWAEQMIEQKEIDSDFIYWNARLICNEIGLEVSSPYS